MVESCHAHRDLKVKDHAANQNKLICSSDSVLDYMCCFYHIHCGLSSLHPRVSHWDTHPAKGETQHISHNITDPFLAWMQQYTVSHVL